MRKIGKLTLGLLVMTAGLLRAEGPSIAARLSSHQISTNDSVTLSIEISGLSNIQPPQLTLPDFNVQGAGQTQSYQWINGQSSSLVTFNYILTPNRAGNFTVPSLTLQHEGKTYQTQPLVLAVKEGDSSPPAGVGRAAAEGNSESNAVPSEGLKPVFLTASVDRPKAYVGQQMVLTIQFLRRPNVDMAARPRYQEPDLTGFVVEPLKQLEYSTNLNGAPYAVTELRYALFPTSDGDFAIGSARVDAVLRTPMDPFDSNNFFQNFFNQGQTIKLATRAIPVQVRGLPKTRPNQFSGAVGRFKISSSVDTKTPEVGKPFNLTVLLEGSGNIKSLREPAIPDISGVRKYDPVSSTKVNADGKILTGSKEIKIPINPQVSGTLLIPGLTYTFFDPENHQFETIQTLPIALNVKPGAVGETAPQIDTQPAPGEPTQGIRVMEKDIRFIKSGSAGPHRKLWVLGPAFWISALAPAVLALLAGVGHLYQQKRREQSSYYRNKEAWSRFRRALKSAKSHLKSSDDMNFYASLQKGLLDYLASKSNQSSAGLVWDSVVPFLTENSVSAEIIKDLRDQWDQIDMARYGLSANEPLDRNAILKSLEAAVRKVEKTI